MSTKLSGGNLKLRNSISRKRQNPGNRKQPHKCLCGKGLGFGMTTCRVCAKAQREGSQ